LEAHIKLETCNRTGLMGYH